jgi:uncharacterized membrane protein
VSELVAFVFRDEFRAPEVLNELRRRDWVWVRDLDEAVAVTLNDDGKARVHLVIDLSTCEAAGWSRFWASLLKTLFLPLTEVMIEAADGLSFSPPPLRSAQEITATPEMDWWRESLGKSDNFKRDVAALMAPSVSVIFMILRIANVPTVLKQLRNYGDTILHTSLSSEQDDKMLSILAVGKGGQS